MYCTVALTIKLVEIDSTSLIDDFDVLVLLNLKQLIINFKKKILSDFSFMVNTKMENV